MHALWILWVTITGKYSGESVSERAPARLPSKYRSLLTVFGYLIIFVGVVLLVEAGLKETSFSKTHNIGLMQDQLMIWQLGLTTVLVGAVFATTGHIVNAIINRKVD
jgi:drug/metabolite transporter (DMT)-like permease